MQGNVLGQAGGSSKINGIIEEYKVASGGNVNAGDFVRLINNKFGDDISLETTNYNSYPFLAQELGKNRLLILYLNNRNLYGMVCTITDTEIICGTECLIATTEEDTILSTVLLEQNKVFLFFGNYYLSGIICTITDTGEINAGLITQLSSYISSSFTCLTPKALLGDNNTILITYIISTKMRGIICTITGTNITKETETEMPYLPSTSSKTVTSIKVKSSQFITVYSNYNGLYGIVYDINDNIINIRINTEIKLQKSIEDLGNVSVEKTDDDTIVIIGEKNLGTIYSLYSVICMIKESTIEVKECKQINSLKHTRNSMQPKITLLDRNRVFITYFNDLNKTGINPPHYLYGMTCRITDTDITEIEDVKLDVETVGITKQSNTIILNKDKILIMYTKNSKLTQIIGHTNLIDIASRMESNIIGIAKTKGTAGQTIKVIVPN